MRLLHQAIAHDLAALDVAHLIVGMCTDVPEHLLASVHKASAPELLRRRRQRITLDPQYAEVSR